MLKNKKSQLQKYYFILIGIAIIFFSVFAIKVFSVQGDIIGNNQTWTKDGRTLIVNPHTDYLQYEGDTLRYECTFINDAPAIIGNLAFITNKPIKSGNILEKIEHFDTFAGNESIGLNYTVEYIDRTSAITHITKGTKHVYYVTNVAFEESSTRTFILNFLPASDDDSYKWETYIWIGNIASPTWDILLDPYWEDAFPMTNVTGYYPLDNNFYESTPLMNGSLVFNDGGSLPNATRIAPMFFVTTDCVHGNCSNATHFKIAEDALTELDALTQNFTILFYRKPNQTSYTVGSRYGVDLGGKLSFATNAKGLNSVAGTYNITWAFSDDNCVTEYVIPDNSSGSYNVTKWRQEGLKVNSTGKYAIVDGQIVNSRINTGVICWTGSSGLDGRIGAFRDGGQNIGGQFDEVYITTTDMNDSQILSNWLNYTEPDSCTYSGSGNWNIDCLDNCDIISAVTGDGSNVNIAGSGTLDLEADINGFSVYHVSGGCVINCNGGCLK